MSIFKEIPPTAGFPPAAKEFFAGLTLAGPGDCLEEDFRTYLNVPYAKVTYSGTAAFYLILQVLKELSPKKTVIIPSFVCPLVPLAIKRAGLKIKVCDIHPDNFNFASDELQDISSQDNDILAIVAVHLAGIPADLESIKAAAEKDKIFIIEDCAQSLGAMHQGRMTGTLGDFSFFSLCRGKGLTIYEGGVAVTNKKEYAQIMESVIEQAQNTDFFSETLKILELFGYWLIYRPQLFWFVFRLPQIYWNWRGQPLKALNEYFTADFGLHRVSSLRKRIGHAMFRRLEEEINQQREKANYYLEKLKGISSLKIITEDELDKAVYPYLTLVFDTAQKRNRALQAFQNSGLGVSQIYLSAITDYDYLKNIVENRACPHARSLAERHISLSTSTFLKQQDLDAVARIIKSL